MSILQLGIPMSCKLDLVERSGRRVIAGTAAL
jgi:hypothetical protein